MGRKDTVARCKELETKMSEGETKVTEAEVKMAEAEKVELEAEEVRRACEAHTERFEHAVSNENGNLYKINYLKEQIRLMTYKCEETEKKHSTMEEQLKEEVEKSEKLDKTRNELEQKSSAEIKGLEKANAKLQEELEKVSTVDKAAEIAKNTYLERLEAELENTKVCLEKSKASVLQPVKDEFEAEEIETETETNINNSQTDFKRKRDFESLLENAKKLRSGKEIINKAVTKLDFTKKDVEKLNYGMETEALLASPPPVRMVHSTWVGDQGVPELEDIL